MSQISMLNLLQIHKRRAVITLGLLSSYAAACYSARTCKSQFIRTGIAGSLATITVESCFHAIDTVNIRTKASEKNISFANMIKKIYKTDGLLGFGKGFSASLYGSAIYGFAYFAIYKSLKQICRDLFGDKVDVAVCYFIAALVTETLLLSVKFPYDLVKCRL